MARLSLDQIKNAILVDRNQLEHEAELHPVLMHAIGEYYVEAVEERDRAKMMLDQTRLQVEDGIRTRWEQMKSGGPRFTEAKLKTATELDTRVLTSVQLVHHKTLAAMRLSNLQDVIRRRGDAISALVSLYVAQYYSVPKVRKMGPR